jgi:hypothetical protein
MEQITLWDYYLENFSIGAQYQREGYTNTYDRKPDHNCTVAVIDHEGNRFKTKFYTNEFGTKVFDATNSRGYDICWWKEVKTCSDVHTEK